MTSRERVIRAIEFKGPDRIPVMHAALPAGILFQDEWGTQRQLIINPKTWRELFKPYYKKLFDTVHNSGRHVHFHTDGNTLDIIPDLIEIGVDVLNPQFSAVNLENLAKIAAGRVCIRSDIDRQYILTRATPEEVDLYVKKIIKS